MKLYLLLLLLLFISSCTFESIIKNSKYFKINFNSAEKASVKLTEIADSLSFTFLHYDRQNPVGAISYYKITKNYIFIVDEQQKLFVFERNGELVSVINNKGKGPAEYIGIEDFVVSRNEKFIVILDPTGGKAIKYNIQGEFVNSYSIKYNHAAHITTENKGKYCIYQSARFSKDNYNLFVTDTSFNLISAVKYSVDGAILKKIPYLLDIQWYSLNDDYFYKEVMVDTVFKICVANEIKLKPHILLDFGNKKIPNNYFTNIQYFQMGAHKFFQLANISESKQYVFLKILYENKFIYYLYSKREKVLCELDTKALLYNSDISINFWPSYINGNTMYKFIGASTLSTKLGSTQSANKIQQRILLNDNPILLSSQLTD